MSPAEKLKTLLIEKGMTLALAESCTGGLLGGAITSVPGASACFLGGVVAYSNELKIDLLAVPSDMIRDHGAVSREVAVAMAEGVVRATGADIGISVTGVAGPGGSEDKPPGTVFIGIKWPGGSRWRFLNLEGGREDVRNGAVNGALGFLVDVLDGGQR